MVFLLLSLHHKRFTNIICYKKLIWIPTKKWQWQIKPLNFNLSICRNVVPTINNLTVSQLKSLFVITAFILISCNLNRHKPNYLKMHFLQTKMWLSDRCACFFSSQLSLPIFRWWFNSWCNEYSRKSASSISCYRGGVFTCRPNMRLTVAPVWLCNHNIHWTFCNKHCIKIICF